MPADDKRYDVALSFAGEQRGYVEETAAALRDAGVRVFYDDYESVELWGENLVEHLDWVYRKASTYCIMFVSADYAEKAWPTVERRSAQARAIGEHLEYILPVRFDQTEVPGLLSTVSYREASTLTPLQLAGEIIRKLGPRNLEPGFPSNVDRLFKRLHAKDRSGKERRNRREIKKVAYSFYRALERMSPEERKAVCGVLAFGCMGDLPDGVHISLDLLSRMTRMPPAEVVDHLSAVSSLNVKVITRESQAIHADDQLVKDDRDLLLSFWSSTVPHRTDSTAIARAMIDCASDHYCENHGLTVVINLDFRNLTADQVRRPVLLPDVGGGDVGLLT